jgi:hypothetical protein
MTYVIHIHLLFLSSFRIQWINMLTDFFSNWKSVGFRSVWSDFQVVQGTTREGQGREEDCGARHLCVSAA